MNGSSRRSFLGGLAAGGLGSLLSRHSAAQTSGNPRRIDVHHHFTPPAYLDFLKAHNQGGGGVRAGRGGGLSAAAAGWKLNEDLDDMDKSGTAVALLSITTPGFGFGQQEEIRKVVRECNEYAAKLRSDHPHRFGSFATVYPPDTEGALREIEHALDTLKADGIGLYSSYGDIWLGDAKLNPVHEELNRRKGVVYVHPIEANCCRNIVKDVTDTVVEYGADTTRTIASLIFSGSTTRYPDITWIFSHAGGMMPFVIERFLSGTQAEVVPGIVTKGQGNVPPRNVPKGALYELRRMYYDTAQTTNPVAMGALRKVVPVSQIVYGTDYWYRNSVETARGLMTNKIFTDEELRAINRGNAERILPRYRA
ncbi:MAG TPA: amidohydrolase family protein [Bryobacteraceae bacterium]|nr:amidohydrolase family protein [Bryobacteraceae bacterium]